MDVSSSKWHRADKPVSETGPSLYILIMAPQRISITLVKVSSVSTCTFDLYKCVLNTYCVSDIMLYSEDKKLWYHFHSQKVGIHWRQRYRTNHFNSVWKCQRIPGSVSALHWMSCSTDYSQLDQGWTSEPDLTNKILSPGILEFGPWEGWVSLLSGWKWKTELKIRGKATFCHMRPKEQKKFVCWEKIKRQRPKRLTNKKQKTKNPTDWVA